MTYTNQILLPHITHDLRNYINGIFGLANIIADNINSYQAKQTKIGAKLDDNLKEASELANMLAPYTNEAFHYLEDMLDTAQAETGKFSLGKIEDCDLSKLIKRLLIFNKGFIRDHRITIETNIEDNLPKLPCDIFRLKQILTNLITNAVKYSKKGNKVNISVRYLNAEDKKILVTTSSAFSLPNYNDENKGIICIEIADHGIGMTEEEISMALNGNGKNIDKLDLNKPIDSYGFGIIIVKQLIDLMKGVMEIGSKKGDGTKVRLWFGL
jgi:signal transduction histidine kinase